MFNDIENLKLISSFRRPAYVHRKTINRKLNAFIIRIKGADVFDFHDKKIQVNEGELIFIPKGVSYEHADSGDLSSEKMYMSLNFEGDFFNPQPKVYSLENLAEYDYITKRFTKLWKYGSPSDRYKCISLFYKLLSHLSFIESADYSKNKKYRLIEPAVNYLKEHIFDCNLKAGSLHCMCNVSDTYFRQIFVSRFGVTPQEYIISTRLAYAKSIFDAGDFDTIGEVALSVGYSDALYFGKAFKKMYGVSPSDNK